jgi:hypothetical protein
MCLGLERRNRILEKQHNEDLCHGLSHRSARVLGGANCNNEQHETPLLISSPD